MVIEFKKRRAPEGRKPRRGLNTAYIPGVYTVYLNGEEVAMIVRRQHESEDQPGWLIREKHTYDRRAPRWSIGQHLHPSLKEAKIHIVRHIKKVYPEAR